MVKRTGPRIFVLSTSTETHSRSRLAAARARRALEVAGADVDWVDLRETPIGVWPSEGDDERRDELVARFNAADGWLIATPVHNWNAAAQTTNFLNHALDRDRRAYRPVVVVAGAGGERSFLALDGLVRSLAHEVQAIVVGAPILVAGAAADKEAGTLAPDVAARIDAAAAMLVSVAGAAARAAADGDARAAERCA